MAGDSLGVMNIVLSADSATFSQGIEKAQRQLNQLSQASTRAGHASVSSTQAASAALRVMSGDMTNNIRAVERFVGMIPGVGAALKYAFPLVGGIAFAGLLVDLGSKVEKFIKDAEELPSRIKAGFDEMHSSAQLTNDELGLTNAKLQNEISKLEGKPQNNLVTSIYETRIEVDKLSESLERSANRVKMLLDKNHVSLFAQMFMGKQGTQEITGSIESFQSQIADLGLKMQDATVRGDKAGAASFKSQIEAKQDAALQWGKNQLDFYNGVGQFSNHSKRDVAAPVNELQGFMSAVYDQKILQSEDSDNSALEAKKDKLTADKEGAAAEKAAREKAAREQMESFEQQLAQLQQSHQLQIGEEEMFWRRMQGQTRTGSENWLAINKKIGAEHQNTMRQLAAQSKELASGQTEVNEAIGRIASMQKRGRITDASDSAGDMVDSNQLAIVNAHNDARQREAEIMDQAGRSMTNYAAAVELAKVHTQEFEEVSQALEGILHARQMVAGLNPSKENNRAVAEAQAAIAEANAHRSTQQESDSAAIYGRSSSATVGFLDAIDDFSRAMKDSASQMRDFFNGTLSSLNGEIVRGISGQRTDFTGMGSDIFRNIAGLGLGKAEGSLFGALGLSGKKKPTGAPGDAIHTVVDNMGVAGGSAVASKVASLATSASSAGGGSKSFLGGLLKSFLPGFASGGAISPDTWAIVGEEGPELFHSGGGGQIIPNRKVDGSANLGSDVHHHYNIDARGATDPAQVHKQIMAAAPHIAAAAVRGMTERQRRTPSSHRSA